MQATTFLVHRDARGARNLSEFETRQAALDEVRRKLMRYLRLQLRRHEFDAANITTNELERLARQEPDGSDISIDITNGVRFEVATRPEYEQIPQAMRRVLWLVREPRLATADQYTKRAA